MTDARLIVVRHGETAWNLESRYQGHLDSPLTALGVAQAGLLGRRLAEEQTRALYSSDLGRARQTAEIIAARTGQDIRFDPRLRERHLGIFQGLSKEEVKVRFPEERRLFKTSGPDYVVPEGESVQQLSERIMACFDELARRHAGETITVVGHGGTIASLMHHTLGLAFGAGRRFKRANASWNVFGCSSGQWWLDTWGDVSHLGRKH
jgi:probable phosphoglycerate mutase